MILYKYIYLPQFFVIVSFLKRIRPILKEQYYKENECTNSAQLGLKMHLSSQYLVVTARQLMCLSFHPCICHILMTTVISEDRLISPFTICKSFL